MRKLLRRQRLLARAYFGYRYLRRDPYGAERRTERRRIEQSLGLLAGLAPYRALEIGCGEGQGARLLAHIASEVLAVDISDTAIRRAEKLHRDCHNLRFRRADLMDAVWAPGRFDLILCSEVLYYLEPKDLEPARRKILDLLTKRGRLLLVHHRSIHDDTAGTMNKSFGARTIHDVFAQSPELEMLEDRLEPGYRITLFRRGSTRPAEE